MCVLETPQKIFILVAIGKILNRKFLVYLFSVLGANILWKLFRFWHYDHEKKIVIKLAENTCFQKLLTEKAI